MEVNARRPSRLFADYVSDAPPLFSSQGNEQGVQPCSPGNVGNDLHSTLTRSYSLVTKGNPGTPRGSSSSLVVFGRRKLRTWHCQMIMAFSVGVVLTYMFAHHPQSPLPASDARAAAAHGHLMTVNSVNERQLASESPPVLRRRNAEVHDGYPHDRGYGQSILEASGVTSRFQAKADLPDRRRIPQKQGPEQREDWQGVYTSGIGQRESQESSQNSQVLPEDMYKGSLETESPLSASGLRGGKTLEKVAVNAAADNGDADRALAQAAFRNAQPRTGAKHHRKAKMSSQHLFGPNATAASPAVNFSPAPRGQSPTLSTTEEARRRSAEQASTVEKTSMQAAKNESSRAVKQTSDEVTEQSESTTIAGQEGFVVSSAVLDEILKGNDQEAFVDVLLDAASLEEDEVGSEEMLKDVLESEEASKSHGSDMLEFILSGASQEVREVNGVINAEIEEGDEVHSRVDIFKQQDTVADGWQGLDLEPAADPQSPATNLHSDTAAGQPYSVFPEKGGSRGAEKGGSRGAEKGGSRGAEKAESRGAEKGESRGAETAAEEPRGKGSADSSQGPDEPAKQQPTSALEPKSESSLREASPEVHLPEQQIGEGSESQEVGGMENQPVAKALEIVFDIDDDSAVQQWKDRAAEERRMQESEGYAEENKVAQKAEEDASATERAEQEHLEGEQKAKEEAERKAKEEAERKAKEMERAQEEVRAAEAAKEAALMVAISEAEDAYLEHLEPILNEPQETRPQLLVEIVEASAEVAKERAEASRKRLEELQAADEQSPENGQEVATGKPVGGLSVDDAVALLDAAHANVLLHSAQAQTEAAAVNDLYHSQQPGGNDPL